LEAPLDVMQGGFVVGENAKVIHVQGRNLWWEGLEV